MLLVKYMPAYTEGKIKMVVNRTFKDRETGEEKPRFTTYIELDTDKKELLQVNAKRDFSTLIGKQGVAQLGIWEREGGGFWVTLIDFKDIKVIE